MLPDMLASWALATVSALYLLESCILCARLWALTGLVLGLANFALCMYPPFQIPLFYLGVLIVT
jgi:hypothetical protein